MDYIYICVWLLYIRLIWDDLILWILLVTEFSSSVDQQFPAVKSLRTQLTGIHPEFAAGQIEVTFIFQQGISYEFEPRTAILRHRKARTLVPWRIWRSCLRTCQQLIPNNNWIQFHKKDRALLRTLATSFEESPINPMIWALYVAIPRTNTNWLWPKNRICKHCHSCINMGWSDVTLW